MLGNELPNTSKNINRKVCYIADSQRITAPPPYLCWGNTLVVIMVHYLMVINNLLHFIKHQLLAWSLGLVNLAAETLFVNRDLIGLDACEYTDGFS